MTVSLRSLLSDVSFTVIMCRRRCRIKGLQKAAPYLTNYADACVSAAVLRSQVSDSEGPVKIFVFVSGLSPRTRQSRAEKLLSFVTIIDNTFESAKVKRAGQDRRDKTGSEPEPALHTHRCLTPRSAAGAAAHL